MGRVSNRTIVEDEALEVFVGFECPSYVRVRNNYRDLFMEQTGVN